jgi:hypothetical protein
MLTVKNVVVKKFSREKKSFRKKVVNKRKQLGTIDNAKADKIDKLSAFAPGSLRLFFCTNFC